MPSLSGYYKIWVSKLNSFGQLMLVHMMLLVITGLTRHFISHNLKLKFFSFTLSSYKNLVCTLYIVQCTVYSVQDDLQHNQWRTAPPGLPIFTFVGYTDPIFFSLHFMFLHFQTFLNFFTNTLADHLWIE